jgi:putative transposase
MTRCQTPRTASSQLRVENLQRAEVTSVEATVVVVPRPPRIDVAGGYYHVASRGNNKQPIYVGPADRPIFLELLTRVVLKHGWVVYAWCLMTNHYHLLLHTPSGGLSAGMQVLNGEFSRRTNRLHGRAGHLFQNRFAYAVIERERHLYESCRYVHLNPCRAGLCARPEEWEWSGHRACLGDESPLIFHAAEAVLKLFGSRPEEARQVYRAFVDSGHDLVSDTNGIAAIDVALWDGFGE